MHTLKEIIKGTADLSYVAAGILYFNIKIEDSIYQLGIDTMSDENKTTYWYTKYKAITLMRWIRKAIEDNSLIQLK